MENANKEDDVISESEAEEDDEEKEKEEMEAKEEVRMDKRRKNGAHSLSDTSTPELGPNLPQPPAPPEPTILTHHHNHLRHSLRLSQDEKQAAMAAETEGRRKRGAYGGAGGVTVTPKVSAFSTRRLDPKATDKAGKSGGKRTGKSKVSVGVETLKGRRGPSSHPPPPAPPSPPSLVAVL
jgi:hypothetical protein